jgi:hypothetical protein
VAKEYSDENWENCQKQARECIYLMRNWNFRDNQKLLEIYVMGVEALIELDEIDESFIREGMTVVFESPAFM